MTPADYAAVALAVYLFGGVMCDDPIYTARVRALRFLLWPLVVVLWLYYRATGRPT